MSGSDASMVERRERSADALLEVLAAAAAESPASESSPASSDGFGIEFGNNPQFWRMLSEFITSTDEAISTLKSRVTQLEAIVNCDTASQRDEFTSD